MLRWCFSALTTVELPLVSLMYLDWTADGSCAKPREFYVGWIRRMLTDLDRCRSRPAWKRALERYFARVEAG